MRPSVVVVTGSSAGVGRAVARAFAARGAAVGLLARGRAGLEAVAAEARELGGRAALAIPTDVADAEAVESAADRVERELGPIDVWVNNAMLSVFAPAYEITAAEYRRVMDVTYLGQVHGTLAALRRMRPRNRGAIILVGSALAYRGIPLQAAYCAAKHAVEGFFDSLRCDLLHERSAVRVSHVVLPALNTTQFGWVRTRMPRQPQPIKPIYQPEVAARAIMWAAEHGPREISVGYPSVLTCWVNKLAPGLLDRYLARTAVRGQQSDRLVELADWQDNIDRPLDDTEDRGAHGRFGGESADRSPQLWATMHKPHVAGLVMAGGALAALGLARRR
ncbi:MAG: SDR family oxidoreductase [Egibacteraceae bacterium]